MSDVVSPTEKTISMIEMQEKVNHLRELFGNVIDGYMLRAEILNKKYLSKEEKFKYIDEFIINFCIKKQEPYEGV